MAEQSVAGDDSLRAASATPAQSLGSVLDSASVTSSRRSSTVRRTNSKRKSATNMATGNGGVGDGTAGAPPATLRQRSSKLGEDSSLTSFPSLSPEASPHAMRKLMGHATSGMGTRTQASSQDADTTPRPAPRMNLVESLMARSSPSARGRDALFADSPATTAQDVPGALHHASDDHIRRLVARRGVVALVRQLAGDLAQREAEMTTLRLRAEARERELKRMLREVEVSNLDIERRLRAIDERDRTGTDGKSRSNRNSLGSVGDLVGEAIGDTLDSRDEDTFLTESTAQDNQATLRATALTGLGVGGDNESLSSSVDSNKKQGWMNYILGNSATVRKQRASSPSSQHETAYKTASAAGRRRGLDDTTFKPLGDEDTRDSSMSRVNSNTSDTAARRVSKSSWTLKLFAGNNPSKDGEAQTGRGRSSTNTSDAGGRSLREGSRESKHTASSATVKGPRNKRNSLQSISTGVPARSDPRSAVPLTSPIPTEAVETLGPVEMDAILPHGSRPPTLSPHELGEGQSDVLTDRFGFIYDQRRRKKEAEAIARSKGATVPQQDRETLGNPFEISLAAGGDGVDQGLRSPTPTSLNEVDEAEDVPDGSSGEAARKWQDYLKISTLSTELLSQTPAPSAISVIEGPKPSTASTATATTAAKKPLKRVPTFGDSSLSSADVTSPNPVPYTSTINAAKAELAKPVLSGPNSPAPPTGPNSEAEPVRLLLAQLGELHDKLQREKTVKWNEFMRKVRAERRREGEQAAAAGSGAGQGVTGGGNAGSGEAGGGGGGGGGSNGNGNADARSRAADLLPEAQMASGEIIGIASLGHKGKVGRAKYREFRALVLSGIPVMHRAKIWSECSGANALRVPGYYQDLLLAEADPQSGSEPAVLAQIEMDISRTLTDNVFFRRGPGVGKLKEILLAYARRNPEVGYCQGMNLITASLLLIMPTAEEAFWILASLIETILPPRYYDASLLASRADQQVLRGYVAELLPRLAQHLDELGVELEALTFQWFLSLFTACLSAEALYRVWDALICLSQDPSNGGSTFLFQVALALLKLNETQLLACASPAEVYAYLGGEITNHAISIDGLIRASDGLKSLVRRDEVEERRRKHVEAEQEIIREREQIRGGNNTKASQSDAEAT